MNKSHAARWFPMEYPPAWRWNATSVVNFAQTHSNERTAISAIAGTTVDRKNGPMSATIGT